ncbi:hypothetical protein VB715_21650 [Crocosphaera sp. UHCC 0190]|uniref:hypothetical protein n=1 Tax=Crocosphaera sp. UHCC 0190 TaxID=3110246 RepID=UPI002B1FD51D|nr:hypothetical protein [Crocosphaera sp. UHCC 0190]MEA5512380.1 hypothetical protein [Crocosphaera sp. UHCC 0190]
MTHLFEMIKQSKSIAQNERKTMIVKTFLNELDQEEWEISDFELVPLEPLPVIYQKLQESQLNSLGLFINGWQYLMSANQFKGIDYKVFMALLIHLNFEEWTPVTQQTIADEIKKHQPNVGQSIKKLLKYKVIERKQDPSDKKRWMYRLNVDLGFGDEDNYRNQP